MKASFTCDHCSAAVDLHARRCPSCGKTFDAVKCPRCSHLGPPAEFSDGCPRCRYLATPRRRAVSRSVFGPVMAVVLALLGVAVVIAWVLRGS